MAAGLAEEADRQLHAWRREVPGLGGETNADRRVAGVAHGGDPGREGHAPALGTELSSASDGGRHEDAHEVGVRRRQVDVHVHEPRQQREIVVLEDVGVSRDASATSVARRAVIRPFSITIAARSMGSRPVPSMSRSATMTSAGNARTSGIANWTARG